MVAYIIEKNELKETSDSNILYRLYYLEIQVPTMDDIKVLNKYKKIVGIDKQRFINDNKKEITKLIGKSHEFPLFDIKNTNIYLVGKTDIYTKVVYDHYRYPTLEFLQQKFDKLKSQLELDKEKTQEEHQLKLRDLKKMTLMINFLNSLDLKILYDIFIKAFYYSNPEGKDITYCQRRSFTPLFEHLKPYYQKDEIIKMAYNMGLIEESMMQELYDDVIIDELCQKVRNNDISSEILLSHQEYIMKKKKYGLIQYFSLHGSYFMNKYLRNLTDNDYKNNKLEESINLMNDLIRNAPTFNRDYVMYRFLHDDYVISKYKIGDIYTEIGFTSTTRDPFYNPETMKFGTVLMKIKIPKNITGTGLAIETISLFPHEQEIVLAPKAMFRLDAKNTDVKYYTLEKYKSLINTQYEFSFIGYEESPLYTPRMPIDDIYVNFLELNSIETQTVNEKINYFVNKYVNDIYQFITKIGNRKYTINVEWYNSTGVYRDFYAAKTTNGFSIYSINKGNIIFMLEIGEAEKPYIYVNYYKKITTGQGAKLDISESDFLDFIASVGFFFNISNIVIYCDYISCDDNDKDCSTYSSKNYCVDFYSYLKDQKKKFYHNGKQISEIQPAFNYFNLDKLKTIKPSELINDRERDGMIYQIYKTIYKRDDSLCEFMIWIIDNQCSLVAKLIQKLTKLYIVDNPFELDYYIFNAAEYLYNRNKISFYQASNVKNKGISKNRNRISEYTR